MPNEQERPQDPRLVWRLAGHAAAPPPLPDPYPDQLAVPNPAPPPAQRTCPHCSGPLRNPNNVVETDGRLVSWCYDCARRYSIPCPECGWRVVAESWTEEGMCCRCAEGRHLHSHNYRPRPNLLRTPQESQQVSIPYFGIELEVDEGECPHTAAKNLPYQDTFYCKRDGSLSSQGLEVVSHPGSLRWWQRQGATRLQHVCSYLSDREYQVTDSCGLHVHISRAAFGGWTHQRKFAWMYHFLRETTISLARRYSHRYAYMANIDPGNPIPQLLDLPGEDRYRCVNFQNEHTLEVRCSSSSLDTRTILASIEWHHSMWAFTQTLSLSQLLGITKVRLSASWIEFLWRSRKTYPNLLHYAKAREVWVAQSVRQALHVAA